MYTLKCVLEVTGGTSLCCSHWHCEQGADHGNHGEDQVIHRWGHGHGWCGKDKSGTKKLE